MDKLKKLVPQLLKILNFLFWSIFIASAIIWFSQNKQKFFPSEPIKEIINPLNPFK